MVYINRNVAVDFLVYKIRHCRFRNCNRFVIRNNKHKSNSKDFYPNSYLSEYYYCSKKCYQLELVKKKVHPDDDPKLLRKLEAATRQMLQDTKLTIDDDFIKDSVSRKGAHIFKHRHRKIKMGQEVCESPYIPINKIIKIAKKNDIGHY